MKEVYKISNYDDIKYVKDCLISTNRKWIEPLLNEINQRRKEDYNRGKNDGIKEEREKKYIEITN